jgi:predicted RNA-binding protein with PUA-like domain
MPRRTADSAPDKVPAHVPARAPRYWLMKSEPDCFSFDDLLAAPKRTTCWDGVRNYQARNFMRDEMAVGDGILYYHSSAEPAGVAGVAEVARAAYPDTTAFDPREDHYDPKSRADEPTWLMVDVRAVERFPRFVTLEALRATPGLESLQVLKRGNRLSITPVTAEEWAIVRRLGGVG